MKFIPLGAECIVVNGAVDKYSNRFKVNDRVSITKKIREGVYMVNIKRIDWPQVIYEKDIKVIALPITKKGRKLK